MSILIKGLDMPKHGDVLVVREYNGKTYIKHEGHLGFEATLTEIPTPHGRLGDLDALVKTLEQNRLCYISDIDDESFELGTNRAIDVVRNTNTIIEAEGSEE